MERVSVFLISTQKISPKAYFCIDLSQTWQFVSKHPIDIVAKVKVENKRKEELRKGLFSSQSERDFSSRTDDPNQRIYLFNKNRAW
jgi:hypothetical protein